MQALVASVELPGVGRVLEATPERPLLVMALELDVPLLIETMRQLPPAPPSGADHGLGLYVVDTRRVADALHMLRCDFARPVRIDELAVTAGMSVSSFHHHFKQLTSMTPLQYQKQLRLLEAKRLMVAENANVTRAAFHVGYESASQFSREYVRMFGLTPRRDALAARTLYRMHAAP